MKVAILDDVHGAYAGTTGVARLRSRAGVHIFAEPFGPPSALAGFEALIANREDGPRQRRADASPGMAD